MSEDQFEVPVLPSGPDSLLEELQIRSRLDVRWGGLYKVVRLPDWRGRIWVQTLRSLRSCKASGMVLMNVTVPQGVVVTLNSVGQIKQFGSMEWYFVYLCECDTASTIPPSTGPHITTLPPEGVIPATQIMTTSGLPFFSTSGLPPSSTGPPVSTTQATTVTPGEPLNVCHDCEPPIPDIAYVTLGGLCALGAEDCCFETNHAWNGTHAVHWYDMPWPPFDDCLWWKRVARIPPSTGYDILYLVGQAYQYFGPPADYWAWRWYVHLIVGLGNPPAPSGLAAIRWYRDHAEDPCDVEGEYAFLYCADSGDCDQSCENSVGATCSVSF